MRQLADAGNTTTLAHYQNLLNQVWFISGLQKYSGRKVSVKSSSPKWLTYNTSLNSVYLGEGLIDIKNQPEKWGRRIEQAIGSYLLNQSRLSNFKLFYWREGNNEVDFVILKKTKLIAIEVKTGKAKFHSGLEKFKKNYKPYKTILISDDTLPWAEFLKIEVDELFERSEEHTSELQSR